MPGKLKVKRACQARRLKLQSFARRTDWQLQPNELACRLSARRAAGLPLLDLTESNPTRCQLAYPEARIRASG